MHHARLLSMLKGRISTTVTVMLIGLTVAAASTGCSSNSQGELNELQNKSQSDVSSSSVKSLDDSDQQLSSLDIAVSPSQSSEEQREKRQLLADYLEEKLGLPVNIEITEDYEAAISLMAEGKVKMAYLGPLAYVRARQRNSQLEPLVAYIDSRTGRPWYTSMIVVNTQSGIQTAEDLKGKRFGFVDQSSSSGFLFPFAYLKSQEIDPERDFSEIQYTGSHTNSVAALASGQVDAIGINTHSYLKAQELGTLSANGYEVLWESDPIPNAPIVISKQLPPDIRLALQEALINSPQDLAALSGAKSDGYTLAQDEDYDPIRELQEALDLETSE